tara:strand:- start:2170 stop:4185 length:2016 start_codon:yes stop_codon:yes gene_type:complete
MATKKVNIDIIAKDKTRMAMQGATRGINNLKNSVFNLKVAFAALGLGFVAKSFLNTATEIENLKVRFKFLFNTVEEGEKAFQGLLKFAGQVPFSLEQIQRGAANLAVVTDSAEEMNELLAITGDIAAASGLDFQTTAEQMMRVWSAGIASADLFRERGVQNMLGFEQGVRMSAEQSKEHILTAFREGTIAIKGASFEMAETFTGIMSMLGDKWLTFKIQLMDAAPFEFLKASAQLLDEAITKNFGSIEAAAMAMGLKIVEGIKAMVLGSASFLDSIKPAFDFVSAGMNTIFTAINAVPDWLAALGIIGFLAMGTKGKLIVITIAAIYNKIQEIFGFLLDFVVSSTEKIAAAAKKLGFDETAKQIQQFGEAIEKVKPKALDSVEDLKKGFERNAINLVEFLDPNEFDDTSGEFRKMVEKILKDIDLIMSHNVKENPVKALNDDTEKTLTNMEKLKLMLGEMTEGFSTGFNEAMKEAGNLMKNMEKVGKESFAKLRESLTNFVMTGKLQFEDLARFIIRSIVEALIGKAISAAINKSMQMFKMDAIKKAMISVYEGALRTFSSIPWPFNMIAVAGAIASGMALVNKIKGFEKGGRPPKNQPSIVGEKGPELFVPDTAGTIVPNNQLGGNPVTVNFNINTVDARGFNELLVNSRGVIVNMINSAVNEKGKVAII